MVALKPVMEIASDLALVFLIVCMNGVALDSWRVARRTGWLGSVAHFARFAIVLAIFFDWFTIVYWDRRYNLVPGLDLMRAMGFHWYWLPRTMLGIAVWRFWRSLKP